MKTRTIHIVTYPETELAAAGMLVYADDSKLTESGREQIRALVDLLDAKRLAGAYFFMTDDENCSVDEMLRDIAFRGIGSRSAGGSVFDHPVLADLTPYQYPDLDLATVEGRNQIATFLEGRETERFLTLNDAYERMDRAMDKIVVSAAYHEVRNEPVLLFLEELVLALLVVRFHQLDPRILLDRRLAYCSVIKTVFREIEADRWEIVEMDPPAFAPRIASVVSLNPPR